MEGITARFEYCESSIEIMNFKYSPEDDINGNPYNCSFQIFVKSGSWSGLADYCECDYKMFRKFVTELEELDNFERTQVEFSEIGYGSKILFEMSNIGHLAIRRVIYGNDMEYSMKFRFIADQTILKGFIAAIQKIIDTNNGEIS